MELGHVSQLFHCTVRFARVPSELAFEADRRHDFLCNFLYCYLLTCAYVYMAVSYVSFTILICVLKVHIEQHMHTGIRHFLAPEELSQRLACAPERNSLSRNAELRKLRLYLLVRVLATYAFHRTQVHVLPYSTPIAFVKAFRQMNLSYHSRQNMAVLEMEVVVRSVQVCRHNGYVVGSVLQIETFAHFKSGYFCYCVRLIGVFQWRSE